MMPPNPLPPSLTASWSSERDDHGHYFPIRLGGRMIAYSDDKTSAEIIVLALNASTAAAVLSIEGAERENVN